VPIQAAPATSPASADGTFTYVPHIVAWNLTKRCNLACAHCYISAGSWQATSDELSTEECLRILDEVLDVNPNPMLILTGGEPLLRDDLEVLVERASSRGATVVVGTNGTRLTDDRIGSLMAAGLKGVAVSVDSLNARYHDRFRHGGGALADTLAAARTADGFADYLAGPGRAAHDRLRAEAEAMGVFGVPTFVLDGEIFWGREHLDLVRQLLNQG